jgi:hypothetical protein
MSNITCDLQLEARLPIALDSGAIIKPLFPLLTELGLLLQ